MEKAQLVKVKVTAPEKALKTFIRRIEEQFNIVASSQFLEDENSPGLFVYLDILVVSPDD